MKKHLFLAVIFFIALAVVMFSSSSNQPNEPKKVEVPVWEIRSVDTVKYSRDLAREMMGRPDFDTVIGKQIGDIASTGATHVAIATPYDEEFVPFLKRWVDSARRNNLKVWFRGNFAGWEGWFGYQKIDRNAHKRLLEEFIVKNPDLFREGDIFTPCPECENGGPGDPRYNKDVTGHRQFLIEEYDISKRAFEKINRLVKPGFYSMNYDVASLIMDIETTKAVGGIVTIDHYVKDPKKVALDSRIIAQKSGGKVVLGEFGAPIPDLHGDMSEDAQSKWIEESLEKILKTPEVIGVNYWTNVGGSARLWEQNGNRRQAVDTLNKYFHLTKTIDTP
jgi:hypothetical protein